MIEPTFPTTKLARLKAAALAGDWRRAIGIASRFWDLGTARTAILRGQSAILSPDFYRQLGDDPDEMVEAAKRALIERYDLKA